MSTGAVPALTFKTPWPLPTGMTDSARAVAETIFQGGMQVPDERIKWVVEEFADLVGRSGRRSATALQFSLAVINRLAPLFVGRLSAFRNLPLLERVRALERMEVSFAGPPVLAVKAILSILYYEHPESAKQVGFDGLSLKPARKPSPKPVEIIRW